MKKLMISLAAVAAIGAAVPAAAQSYGYNGGYNGGYGHNAGYDRYNNDNYGGYGADYGRGDDGVNQREAQIARELRRADVRGQIDHRLYTQLSLQLGHVEMIERHYRARGFDPREVADIHARLDQVEANVSSALSNSSRYGYGYGDQRYGDQRYGEQRYVDPRYVDPQPIRRW